MRTLALVTVVALAVVVVMLGRAVVRLENYRYADYLGFCDKFDRSDPRQVLAREDCLNNTETRSHWFWHLLHATGAF
jgi:hypothetical protein